MQLTFVDNNGTLDNATRSVVRREAAKGHNLGRKINRPSRVKALQRRSQQNTTAYPSPVSSTQDDQDEILDRTWDAERSWADLLVKVEPVIGDSISILSLPIQVAKEDRALMYEAANFMSSPRFAPGLASALDQSNRHQSIYHRLMFTDQAYYHCSLAVVSECCRMFPEAGNTAMRHLTNAFRLINKRISDAKEVSNPTIAVVMSLSTYESTRGRYKEGLVHITGLLRMIEMRGGLHRVGAEEPEIMQKAYRGDLDYALRLGNRPKLDIKLFENSAAMETLDMRPCREAHDLPLLSAEFRQDLGDELSQLWERATDLSVLVNEASAGQRAKLPTAKFLRSHVWVGHRLLSFAPLDESRNLNRNQRVAYLGLVTLVSSFVCGLDRRVAENSILAQLIREEARKNTSETSPDMLLWLLFLAGAVILQDPSHDMWLLPKTWEQMQNLKLTTWEGTKKILTRYPWINDYFENEAFALYNRIAHYGGDYLAIIMLS